MSTVHPFIILFCLLPRSYFSFVMWKFIRMSYEISIRVSLTLSLPFVLPHCGDVSIKPRIKPLFPILFKRMVVAQSHEIFIKQDWKSQSHRQKLILRILRYFKEPQDTLKTKKTMEQIKITHTFLILFKMMVVMYSFIRISNEIFFQVSFKVSHCTAEESQN